MNTSTFTGAEIGREWGRELSKNLRRPHFAQLLASNSGRSEAIDLVRSQIEFWSRRQSAFRADDEQSVQEFVEAAKAELAWLGV